MRPATLNTLKKSLAEKSAEELMAICLRMAKYKAENKELLTYLLLEADDEESYIAHIKESLADQMDQINDSTAYFAKKGLRKTARLLQKWIRFSGKKTTEVELRIRFCQQILERDLPVDRNKVMNNLYWRQIENIRKAIGSLHEDLQYDYHQEVEGLEEMVRLK